MSNSPLACWRARNGRPAPLPLDVLTGSFFEGAVRVEWSGSSHVEYSHSSCVEWANGFCEFSLLTQDCADGEAFGFRVPNFTCMTAVHRLYEVTRLYGMAIGWGSTIVTDEKLVHHYEKGRGEDRSIDVASSFENLVEIMSIVWVNCPPEAMHVA